MNIERVKNYLKRIGITCKVCQDDDILSSASFYVKSVVNSCTVEMLGARHHIILVKCAKVNLDMLGAICDELAHRVTSLVLCFESNDRDLCSWLRKHSISYIIPGRQAYLPPRVILESDRAYSDRVEGAEYLSTKAQLVLIWYLLNRALARSVSYAEVMSALKLKQFDVSRVAKELVALGVAEIAHAWPRASIAFKYERRELWMRTKEVLRSPVKKTMRVLTIPTGALDAGITALTMMSDLMDNGPRVLAVGGEAAKSLDGSGTSKYEGDILEVWRYDPCVLVGAAKTVDPISLYLSLRSDPDPRVEIALKKIEEGLF